MTLRHLKSPSWLRKLTSLLQPKKVYKKKSPFKKESHHNLKDLFDEINETYFSKALSLQVDWSGQGKTSSRSSVRLGYYNTKTQQIKISRILDYPHIPRYVISFILYHEILHHTHPPLCSFGSRRRIHHPEFKQKEKEFQEYEAAQLFLKELKKEIFAPSKKIQ